MNTQLQLPTVGTVLVNSDTAAILRQKSLATPLNGRLFPCAGKSAALKQWMDDNMTIIEPTGQQQYPRTKPKRG